MEATNLYLNLNLFDYLIRIRFKIIIVLYNVNITYLNYILFKQNITNLNDNLLGQSRQCFFF